MFKNMKFISLLAILVILLAGCGSEVTDESTPYEKQNEEIGEVADVDETQKVEESSNTEEAIEPIDMSTLKDLETANNQLVAIFNELAGVAEKNNWGTEEVTKKEIDAVYMFIQLNNSVLLDQSGITTPDIEDLIATSYEFYVEMDTNFREKVSVIYTAPSE